METLTRSNSAQASFFSNRIQKADKQHIIEYVQSISGQVSQRKFKKCGLLGNGGFANCFIVQNVQTKKRAAAKIISKDALTSYRTKLRLMNQIKLHKTFHHPNIVQFYHFFEDKKNVYIFLELCENQSLNEMIKVRNTFTTPEIQAFIYGLVQGIKYLHAKHVIHRDIKLGNIFVDDKMNIKIGDFGLATKLQFQREFKRTVCGTPNYIAPQILQGKGYHFEVDIWSVGVIMYTLYTGYPPFQTEDAQTTYKRIKQIDYYLPPRTPEFPYEAINLIKRILVKNPAKRPTLDEILQSDFMRLGKGIYMNLPLSCAKKAPSSKQLKSQNDVSSIIVLKKSQSQANVNNRKNYKHQRTSSIDSALVNENSNHNKFQVRREQTKIVYVTGITELGQDNYIYYLSDNSKHVYSKQENYVFYRRENGKLVKNFLDRNPQKLPQTCDQTKILVNILNNQTNVNIILGKKVGMQFQDQSEKHQKAQSKWAKKNFKQSQQHSGIFVKKLTKYDSFFMLKLSNESFQILFEKGDGFYIFRPQQVHYFDKKGKMKWMHSNYIINMQDQHFPVGIQMHKIHAIRNLLIFLKQRSIKWFYCM